MPLFGRSGSLLNNKKLEPAVYLGNDYLLAMDFGKSIYIYRMYGA